MDYLKMLRSQLEGIAGNWNGDESGIAEDRARAAIQGIENIQELETILEELKINN